MKLVTRRWILGVGTALLVGGWSMTRYAHEQQQSGSEGQVSSYYMWIYGPPGKAGTSHMAGKTIFGTGGVAMAVGAGLIGFAFLRDRSDGGGD